MIIWLLRYPTNREYHWFIPWSALQQGASDGNT